jgi:hypothetical protein
MAVRDAKRTGEAFSAKQTTKVAENVDGARYAKATNVQEGFMLMGSAKEKRVRANKKQIKTLIKDVAFKVKSSDAPPPEREERRGGGGGGFRGGRGGSRGGARGGARGGRGGRGGARGGAVGAGAAAGGRPAPTGPRGAINPNDSSAFPALGA